MATIHLLRTRPLLTPFTLSLGLCTTFYAQQNLWRQRRPLLCDSAISATPATTISESLQAYQHDAKVPVFQNGRPNPRAYSQISAGSMLGVLGGVAVSSFSKTLATTFGLAIFLIQYMASKGFNIIPTSRIQRYVKGIDLRSAIEDNVAFKLSFGLTFALASLASF